MISKSEEERERLDKAPRWPGFTGNFWNGSGTWDVLDRPRFPYDIYVHKTLTLAAITEAGKVKPWGEGVVNKIGLTNPGVRHFTLYHLPRLRRMHRPVVVSLFAPDPFGWVKLAEHVANAPGVVGIELNLSCPNQHGGVLISHHQVEGAVREVRLITGLKLGAKFAPDAKPDLCKAAEDAGADYLCLGNSLRTSRGGLSGLPIQSLTLEFIEHVAKRVGIPIVGMGGIRHRADPVIQRFLDAGATDIGIGSANLELPHE